MRQFLRKIACATLLCGALVFDQAVVADTLDIARDSAVAPLWQDTMAIPQDSTLGSHSTKSAWLFPLGLIVATGAVVFLLFTTRSR